MTWSIVVACSGAVLLGSFAQGALGFGFGMICMAIMTLFLDIKVAVAVVAVVGLVVNGGVLFQTRTHMDKSKYWPLLVGGLIGVPCGVSFLVLAPKNIITGILGLVILAYVLWRSVGKIAFETQPNYKWGVVAGLLGGALGGAFNTSGPPAVMYVSGRSWSPNAVKATLQVFFCLNSVVQLSLYGYAGYLTCEVFTYDLILLPFGLLGVWLGGVLSSRFSSRLFEHLVMGGLVVLGVVFLVRSVG